MATTLKDNAPAALTTGYLTQYTVPALTKGIITEIVLYNDDASARTAYVHACETGTVAGVLNRIFGDLIPAKKTVYIQSRTILGAGDFVSAKASVGAVISMRVSAIEKS